MVFVPKAVRVTISRDQFTFDIREEDWRLYCAFISEQYDNVVVTENEVSYDLPVVVEDQ